MNTATYNLILDPSWILDDNINTKPYTNTPISPDRGHIVRLSAEKPENQLAAGNGIMDGYSIQGAVVTHNSQRGAQIIARIVARIMATQHDAWIMPNQL